MSLNLLFLTVTLVVSISILSTVDKSMVAPNNPPEVVIIKPIEGTTLRAGGLVPFEIEVSDQEDGKSEYDEINPNEVILQIQYISDSINSRQLVTDSDRQIPLGLGSMRSLNCFDCHRPNSPLIGPSFADVAKKYFGALGSSEYLIEKIISGSKGTWGEQEMPPNPELSKEKAAEIVQWILKEGIKKDLAYYVGLVGAFKVSYNHGNDNDTNQSQTQKAIPNKNNPNTLIKYAVLTAFYQDHATDGLGLTGHHTVVLSVEN